MKDIFSSIWLRTLGMGMGLALMTGACGDVVTPVEPDPPAQTQPTQNQVTSAAGVVKGARFTMHIQVGHAYSQETVANKHQLGTASPLANPASPKSE